MQTSPSKTCQYCGTGGLQWQVLGDKYRLAYPDGSLHLCRATRDKLVKSIHVRPIGPLTYEQHLLRYLTKEGVKWALRHQPSIEIPPSDYMDAWYSFVDMVDTRKASRGQAARQEILLEMIP